MLIDDSLKVGDMVSFKRGTVEKTYHIVYSITPSRYNPNDKSVNMKVIGSEWKRQALLRAEMMNNKHWTKE